MKSENYLKEVLVTKEEIQAICEQLDDQTTIPDPPASAKNAFAMTLFCMESAFDCRSKDFLKYDKIISSFRL